MNVKKIHHKDKILNYLKKNSSSEVKDIAKYVGVTKQSLYYHIKSLLKEDEITISNTSIVNGIEKKFYSLNKSEKKTLKSKSKNRNKKSTKKRIERSKKSISVKNKQEDPALLNPHSYLIQDDEALEAEIKKYSLMYNNDSTLNEIISDVDNDTTENPSQEQKNKKKNNEITNGHYKNYTNPNKTHSRELKKQSLFENIGTVFYNIKSLGLFNIDSYDAMGSETALITSNQNVICFNNRRSMDFVINSKKNSKKNNRLIVIDENFIDNHVRILSPLRKSSDQQNFIQRYIQRKYNISSSDLTYTYEVFDSNEKGIYELNTLFSQTKYLENSKSLIKDFPNKDKLFISLPGLFSHYNTKIDSKVEKVNLYIFFGKKDCEITWVRGSQIMYNRSIIITNQAIGINEYVREILHRVVKTIDISKNILLKEQDIGEISNDIYISGPNATNDLLLFFKEKYNLSAKRISLSNSKIKNTENEYYDTTKVIKKSMNKWGRFKYVYNQDEKLRLRKTGKRNLTNLFSIVLAVALLIVNVNFIEKNIINEYDKESINVDYILTLKLIETYDKSIRDLQKQNNIDQYLSNIKIAKTKVFQLLQYLNSDIFEEVNFKNIELRTTPTDVMDRKEYEISINAEIVNRRPEAIIEAENINIALRDSDLITNGMATFRGYSTDRLPILITFIF